MQEKHLLISHSQNHGCWCPGDARSQGISSICIVLVLMVSEELALTCRNQVISDSLTHWGREKMDAISQATFWSAFSWMKMFEFRLKFHWSLFLRVQLTIFQHWFRQWLGAVQATSHYLNQWWLDYRRIYASLGLNELNRSISLLPMPWLLVLPGHQQPWYSLCRIGRSIMSYMRKDFNYLCLINVEQWYKMWIYIFYVSSEKCST